MTDQRVFILRGRHGTNGNVFGLNLFRPEAGVQRDVALSSLYGVSFADEPGLFRAVNDFAREQNFAAGFPTFNFNEATKSVGCVLLRAEILTVHDAPRADLGGSLDDIADLFIASRDFAREHQYRGGFPTLHRAGGGNDAVYRLVLLNGSGLVTGVEMPVESGWRPWDSIGLSFRQANKFATERGFLGALPNFRHSDRGDELSQSERRLNELLEQGWRVKSVTACDGTPSGPPESQSGLFYSAAIVVLER